MLYVNEGRANDPVWVNNGMAKAQVCQGHSVPWVLPERLGAEIMPKELRRLT
jgi:hypothetical protein